MRLNFLLVFSILWTGCVSWAPGNLSQLPDNKASKVVLIRQADALELEEVRVENGAAVGNHIRTWSLPEGGPPPESLANPNVDSDKLAEKMGWREHDRHFEGRIRV